MSKIANWLQVGSPPSDMAWSPPKGGQHGRSPFETVKEETLTRVSPAPMFINP